MTMSGTKCIKVKFPLEIPISLPKQPKLKTLVVDKLGLDSLKHCYDLYSQQGPGIGMNEFSSVEIFKKTIFDQSHAVFGAYDKDIPGELLGGFNITPSPLCRSQRPVFNAGYVVVAKPGQGLGAPLYVLYALFAQSMGYYGLVGRRAISNPFANKMTQNSGINFDLGIIPCSIFVQDLGWTGDAIHHMEYIQKAHPSLKDIHNRAEVPPLPSMPQLEAIKEDTWQLEFNPTSIKLPNGMTAVFQKASLHQKLLVEHMIVAAALKTNSFGIDEFTPDGVHNRKFFQKSLTLVLNSSDEKMVGALVVGPSNACREPESPILHAYAILKEHDDEIGQSLMKMACDLAKRNNFCGVLADVFVNDLKTIAMLRSLGFSSTGFLPYSAFLRGHGYSDCALMYKPFLNSVDVEAFSKLFKSINIASFGFQPDFLDKFGSKL